MVRLPQAWDRPEISAPKMGRFSTTKRWCQNILYSCDDGSHDDGWWWLIVCETYINIYMLGWWSQLTNTFVSCGFDTAKQFVWGMYQIPYDSFFWVDEHPCTSWEIRWKEGTNTLLVVFPTLQGNGGWPSMFIGIYVSCNHQKESLMMLKMIIPLMSCFEHGTHIPVEISPMKYMKWLASRPIEGRFLGSFCRKSLTRSQPFCSMY